ncbi:MAG: threonine ammonia-lyase [Candidatus Hodarchaeota archaeon]
MVEVTLVDIQNAKKILKNKVKRTPLIRSATISQITECEVFIKYENLQKAGSFKIRGAYNKIAHLKEEIRRKGVIAASTGNHAQGVAVAASLFGIPATIVMPVGAPIPKIEATRGYGATVECFGTNFDESFDRAKELEKENNLTFIHAFDDPYIIAGQGTIGLEILEDLPDVDVVIAPIGGGGLISGIATAIRTQKPECQIIGVQSKEMDAAFQSFKKGFLQKISRGYTIADGIAIKSPSELTFSIIKSQLHDIITVDEEEIARAVLILLERCKSVVEGAGAVSLAALLHRNIVKKGQKIVLVITGGNIDITMLGKIITQGLTKAGRYQEVRVIIEDTRDKLDSLLRTVASLEANIINMNLDRFSADLPFNQIAVDLTLETKGRDHSETILEELKKNYNIKHI